MHRRLCVAAFFGRLVSLLLAGRSVRFRAKLLGASETRSILSARADRSAWAISLLSSLDVSKLEFDVGIDRCENEYSKNLGIDVELMEFLVRHSYLTLSIYQTGDSGDATNQPASDSGAELASGLFVEIALRRRFVFAIEDVVLHHEYRAA